MKLLSDGGRAIGGQNAEKRIEAPIQTKKGLYVYSKGHCRTCWNDEKCFKRGKGPREYRSGRFQECRKLPNQDNHRETSQRGPFCPYSGGQERSKEDEESPPSLGQENQKSYWP